MNPIFNYLFAITVLFASCNTPERNKVKDSNISLEEYFPVKEGNLNCYYVSHITETDTFSDNNDSSIFKSVLVNDKEIFYIDKSLKDDDNTIIGSSSFCRGVFFFEMGKLHYSPIFWKSELEEINLDYFEVLFPNPIKLDTTYQYWKGSEILKYRFLGFESIEIKDKSILDCLKLTINQDWPTAQYVDTVWFQKNIGVVKWYRSTGRLEEIIQ